MKRCSSFFLLMLLASAGLAVTPGKELFLPSVSHAQGSCPGGICSQWRSDVWIFNPDQAKAANVTIYLLERAETNPAPAQAGPFTIAPGQTKELLDVVLGTFGKEVNGALRVVSDIPVLVTGRVFDDNVVTNKGTGTAGQFFAGIPAELAIGNGGVTDIIGLAQDTDSRWRSNFGFVETTGKAVTLTLDLMDAGGATLKTWTPAGADAIGALGVRQFNLSKLLTPPPGLNLRLRVRVTGGNGKVLAFGSRLDNRTGDPSTVEMSMTPPATECPGVPTAGPFEGVVLKADGTSLNGSVHLTVGSTAITSLAVLSGVPCPADETGVLVDVSGADIALDATGHFSVTLPAQAYAAADGTTAFSTVWTVAGGRNADGSLSGTLQSVTSGGTNKTDFNYAQCNGTVSGRAWRVRYAGP